MLAGEGGQRKRIKLVSPERQVVTGAAFTDSGHSASAREWLGSLHSGQLQP